MTRIRDATSSCALLNTIDVGNKILKSINKYIYKIYTAKELQHYKDCKHWKVVWKRACIKKCHCLVNKQTLVARTRVRTYFFFFFFVICHSFVVQQLVLTLSGFVWFCAFLKVFPFYMFLHPVMCMPHI